MYLSFICAFIYLFACFDSLNASVRKFTLESISTQRSTSNHFASTGHQNFPRILLKPKRHGQWIFTFVRILGVFLISRFCRSSHTDFYLVLLSCFCPYTAVFFTGSKKICVFNCDQCLQIQPCANSLIPSKKQQPSQRFRAAGLTRADRRFTVPTYSRPLPLRLSQLKVDESDTGNPFFWSPCPQSQIVTVSTYFSVCFSMMLCRSRDLSDVLFGSNDHDTSLTIWLGFLLKKQRLEKNCNKKNDF